MRGRSLAVFVVVWAVVGFLLGSSEEVPKALDENFAAVMGVIGSGCGLALLLGKDARRS